MRVLLSVPVSPLQFFSLQANTLVAVTNTQVRVAAGNIAPVELQQVALLTDILHPKHSELAELVTEGTVRLSSSSLK